MGAPNEPDPKSNPTEEEAHLKSAQILKELQTQRVASRLAVLASF
jgi:hypothetical protein